MPLLVAYLAGLVLLQMYYFRLLSAPDYLAPLLSFFRMLTCSV